MPGSDIRLRPTLMHLQIGPAFDPSIHLILPIDPSMHGSGIDYVGRLAMVSWVDTTRPRRQKKPPCLTIFHSPVIIILEPRLFRVRLVQHMNLPAREWILIRGTPPGLIRAVALNPRSRVTSYCLKWRRGTIGPTIFSNGTHITRIHSFTRRSYICFREGSLGSNLMKTWSIISTLSRNSSTYVRA